MHQAAIFALYDPVKPMEMADTLSSPPPAGIAPSNGPIAHERAFALWPDVGMDPTSEPESDDDEPTETCRCFDLQRG